jgi:hypothetical protein
MENDFSPSLFRRTAEEALILSSEYINQTQTGDIDLSGFRIKGDKTAVTIVDEESQRLARPIILSAFPQYRLNQEEADGESGNLQSNLVVYHDPLDGTGGFLINAPTPTVILGVYDSVQKKILAAATMEPSTGTFCYSARGEGSFSNKWNYDRKKWKKSEDKRLEVNKKQETLKGSKVLVDLTHPFPPKNPTLIQRGRRELTTLLENSGSIEVGQLTNGGHYMRVAEGGPTLAGCITTAIGGPFDIVGLLHVTEAGGFGQCYEILRGRERELSELSPQDIEHADIAIAANNANNLRALEEIVRTAVRYN